MLFKPFDHNQRRIQQPPPTAASSKTELFVTLVNGRKLLGNVTQSCIFDVAGVLDTPLMQKSYIVEKLFAERQIFVEHTLVPASRLYWLFCHYIYFKVYSKAPFCKTSYHVETSQLIWIAIDWFSIWFEVLLKGIAEAEQTLLHFVK